MNDLGHSRVAECVGAVVSALANQAFGVEAEPTARGLPDIAMMDVSVQNPHIALVSEQLLGEGGTPYIDRTRCPLADPPQLC